MIITELMINDNAREDCGLGRDRYAENDESFWIFLYAFEVPKIHQRGRDVSDRNAPCPKAAQISLPVWYNLLARLTCDIFNKPRI